MQPFKAMRPAKGSTEGERLQNASCSSRCWSLVACLASEQPQVTLCAAGGRRTCRSRSQVQVGAHQAGQHVARQAAAQHPAGQRVQLVVLALLRALLWVGAGRAGPQGERRQAPRACDPWSWPGAHPPALLQAAGSSPSPSAPRAPATSPPHASPHLEVSPGLLLVGLQQAVQQAGHHLHVVPLLRAAGVGQPGGEGWAGGRASRRGHALGRESTAACRRLPAPPPAIPNKQPARLAPPPTSAARR